MKKCDFSRLLEETNIKYYWLGFLFADGSFSKRREIKIGLSKKDLEHLLKLKDFLKINSLFEYDKSYHISGKDTIVMNVINSRYKIESDKTHNPPDISSIKNLDFLFSMVIGFIDGDGSIKKLKNRPDYNLTIKCHSSWLDMLNYFTEILYNDTDCKIVKAKIDSYGYAKTIISNSIVLKKIKTKAIELKLPILNRKWDSIDLKYVSRVENCKQNLEKIRYLLSIGKKNKEICNLLGIKQSTLSNLIKRKKLKEHEKLY